MVTGELDGVGWSPPGYRITGVLGRGGFATVYRARQLNLGRDVAIKVLAADLATTGDRRRFDRERQSLVSLSGHPHVVDVLDAGITPERRPFLVMRLCPGGSLMDRVAREGPLPPGEVVDVITKIGSALDAAHALGIVHRDVKPENVLLADDGRPVLGDFGIAAIVHPDLVATHLSTAFFTLAHAAPETLQRQGYGVASDVYALASTAYQLLTGRRAFDPTNPRIMTQILDDPPAPITEPWVPPAMADVVAAALAKDPDARPPSAGSFATALAFATPVAAHPGSPSAPPSAPSSPPQLGSGGQGSGGQGSGGRAGPSGRWRTWDVDQPGTAGPPGRSAPRRRAVLAAALLGGGSAVAAGVTYLVTTLGDGTGEPAGTGSGAAGRSGRSTPAATSVPPRTAAPPAPTPGSRRGDELHLLTGHDDVVQAVAWAPAGGLLATVSSDRTGRIWDPGTGSNVWTLVGHGGRVRSVTWSGDGRRLATGSDDGTVRIWDVDTGRCLRVLSTGNAPVGGVAWSPDGRRLASGGDIIRIWDPASGKVLHTVGAGTTTQISWSPDGGGVAASNTDHTVRIWDPNGGGQRQQLFGHAAPTSPVAWSPDGHSLATLPDDGTAVIWDPASGRRRYTLTTQGMVPAQGVGWSTDGRRLAVAADQVWVWSTGNGQLLHVLDRTENARVVAWAPDGRTLATGGEDNAVQIWVA